MKKIIFILFMAATVFACSDDLSEVNVDTKNPTEVPADVLFSNATKNLFDQMVNTNVNTNIFRLVAQYWTETTYTDEANYDLVGRNINGSQWIILYRDVLKDLKEADMILTENPDPTLTEANLQNRKAMIEILQVFTWHVLVDTFGDIPYTEALNADDSTPVYDDDAAIYADLVVRLNAAISQLEAGAGGFGGGADYIYNGDAAQWSKFANSLKLRLALRYANVDDAKAATMATEAIAAGVFESHADDATIQYLASAPNTNPLWEDLVQSGRADFVAAHTIVDVMNELDDPRRNDYFAQNLGEGVYEGGTYGANGNTQGNSTIYSEIFEDPTLEGVILDYTEVEFLIAEAAARGYITEDAEAHYNEAITSSILYWGGTEEEANEYLAQPEVAWDETVWVQRLGMQKWIALYNRGFEAWSTWRKLDVPELPNAAQSGLPVPLRFTYPTTEATLNGENLAAAISAMGGDELQTRIFWDLD
ncbi:SusD/RagB family nutrient-binding outer membrane lipoprotein [Salinimicrobium sp. TH3]|uniref:SusD/RagB family nutrient-binding outer membrane lipoprotein n=1 Tax=Salinimicrobium sp. TH3 TaxID=2997342 RepID=UPI0022731F0A|nr:SusD/RagB family nutrient-binding outer membrane lipoprotein [Salinimicrobium sp. TH3]MCY2688330.1 SusD/RagB family nutrient-binding outer membrane lipoprotein [Salinimicrobium sp. TH3]